MFRKLLALAGALACALVVAPPGAKASITLNLTTAGASETRAAALGGNFTVTQIDPQSTGTGVINPFVRIQAHGNEHGYNTSLGTPLDDKAPSGGFTRALLLSEIPIVNILGVDYRQFLLDVNEDSGGPRSDPHELLSLNQIQIFQAAADQLHTGVTTAAADSPPLISFGAATPVFRMNNGGPGNTTWFEILLDYSLNHGSGSGDMFLYVRDDAFISAGADFVIMYSQFGSPGGASSSSDGFEEWAVLDAASIQAVPEPGSLVLMGLGALGLAGFARRKRTMV